MTSDSTGANYFNFFLRLVTTGNDARGSVSETIPIIPYNFASYNVGDTMAWDAYGMELGYDYSLLRGESVDAFGNVTYTPTISPSYKLDPTVMLVPIQLVRVLPRNPATSRFAALYNATQRVYKKFWDGQLIIDEEQTSVPGMEYYDTRYAYSTEVQSAVPPDQQLPEDLTYTNYFGLWATVDSVWAQCGIQFRMINCSTATGGAAQVLGCPDLLVDSDDMLSPPTCEYDPTSLMNYQTLAANEYAARTLPGIRRDVPIVVTMASISGVCTNAAPQGSTQLGASGLTIGNLVQQGSQPRYVASHEMGLLLGVNEIDNCTASTARLMCEDTEFMTGAILPEECARARQGIAGLVDEIWGVTVQP